MMVVRATILLCIGFVAANIEFKHHNNTELAAILQRVKQAFHKTKIIMENNFQQSKQLQKQNRQRGPTAV